MLKAIAAGKHTNQKTLYSVKYVLQVATNKTQKDIVSDVIKKRERCIPLTLLSMTGQIGNLKNWPQRIAALTSTICFVVDEIATHFHTASDQTIYIILHISIAHSFTTIRFKMKKKKKEGRGSSLGFSVQMRFSEVLSSLKPQLFCKRSS